MLTRLQVALQSPDGLRRLFHFALGKLLFSLPVSLRRRLFHGHQVTCPLCKSTLCGFLRLHRRYHLYCPVCGSLQRQRLAWLLLERQGLLAGLVGKRMLHIAPEPCLEAQFRRIPGLDYLSADLNNPRAMHKMDITNLPLPDDSFDFIYCSHVLEHVADDRRALAELCRVLHPGGQALLLVPLGSALTDEDPSVIAPLERERRFGQFDHLRRYGLDFADRMGAAGFTVRLLQDDALGLSTADMARLGLESGEILFLGQKPPTRF